MIYLLAVVAGFVLGYIVIRLDIHMRRRIYNLRVKEVKEELTQSKPSTEPSIQRKSLDASLVQRERQPV